MYLMTSESVSPGHPDKVCDVISDMFVQEYLSSDPDARVAIETCAFGGEITLGGEIKSMRHITVSGHTELVRNALKTCGYDSGNENVFSSNETLYVDEAGVRVLINAQSPEISIGVDQSSGAIGAGDQGIMFGYACSENTAKMPMAMFIARALMIYLWKASVAKSWDIGPDIKTQVTLDYGDESNAIHHTTTPKLHSIVASFPVKSDAQQDLVVAAIRTFIVSLSVGDNNFLIDNYDMHINNTGAYVLHSPLYDAGLTGRKIVVDTYGGYAPVGGGAQSGKDYTKVDRSALYASRWLAGSLVKSGVYRNCTVGLSYVIGKAEPESINITGYKLSGVPTENIVQAIKNEFSLTPAWIRDKFKLDYPQDAGFSYVSTAMFGQVGNTEVSLPWEQFEDISSILP